MLRTLMFLALCAACGALIGLSQPRRKPLKQP